ncbi:VOC family protein [Paracidovorax citrulli]
MATQIFVNLHVKDLDRSVDFFTRLGYRFDPRFTDRNATCMVVSDSIFVMLLVEPFFQTFTGKAICDTAAACESIVALSCESREAVDDMVSKATAAGARTPNPPKDYGFMYQHGFEDLDGHLWEVFHMAQEPAEQT